VGGGLVPSLPSHPELVRLESDGAVEMKLEADLAALQSGLSTPLVMSVFVSVASGDSTLKLSRLSKQASLCSSGTRSVSCR
jgi:hypothetical protein